VFPLLPPGSNNGVAPSIISLHVSDGYATLTWTSTPGFTYALQYKDSLEGTDWTELPPITAESDITTGGDPVGETPERFYRVVEKP